MSVVCKIISEPLSVPQAPLDWVLQNSEFRTPQLHYSYLEYLGEQKSEEYLFELNNYYDVMTSPLQPISERCCWTCNLLFPDKKNQTKHFVSYNHKVAIAKKKNLPIPEDPRYCKLCNKHFKSEKLFKNHCKKKEHTDKLNPSFHCEICNTTYKNRRQLNKHKRIGKTHQRLLAKIKTI